MPKPKLDYPYLRAWNRLMAGPATYNVAAARDESAPPTAIYRDRDGRWATYEEIIDPDAKRRIDHVLAEWGVAPTADDDATEKG
ncbi:MAG: hypothetical protein KGL39_55645 [Patescibacteria group bacterium]|nr:hypothetical protein [Patescibacteria group bacterium]